MSELGLTKNQVITELTRSPHGELTEYIKTGRAIAEQDPEFAAHLIAWNARNGQIRDSKVALPVVTLSVPGFNGELSENSLAHLATLDPRNLLRAVRFAKQLKIPAHGRALRRVVEKYLRAREAKRGWWDATTLQHRATMKELYALNSVKPGGEYENTVLFGRTLDKTKAPLPRGSVFEAVARLRTMSPVEAAGTIITRKIPFLVAVGALGARMKETDLVLALINQMSPTELVNNTKMLERLGIKTVPALRGAYEEALRKAASAKTSTFKATRAAEAVEDEALKEKLKGLQEKQISALGGVEGNWLVLGDKSQSMTHAIDAAKTLANQMSLVKNEFR